MKLPIDKSPYKTSDYNIKYDVLQKLDYEELKEWIDGLRSEVLKVWDEDNIPPSMGKNHDEIIQSFKKLSTYDTDKIWVEDENYKDYLGFIRNFTNVGAGVNQFFPFMLKTKINGRSMYDWFSDEDLILEFRRTMVRALRHDGMYSFSKYLDEPNLEEFISDLPNTTGWWLESVKNTQNVAKNDNSIVSLDLIKKLLKAKILKTDDFRNSIEIEGDDETIGYRIRTYDKSQYIFPSIIQIFRLSLGQPPVNFPPLTARLIYEKYLGEFDQDDFIVYDMCSGWGGRLLGALSSNLRIHYVGTDVNSNNKGSYEALGKFYNNNCGGKNSYEMFDVGCEVINQNKNFQKYKGRLDLCFTSPPYFDREQYSDDDEQSYRKYPNYSDWVNGFLNDMISICYEYLKEERYMIINIADIKIGDNRFLPIEQSTIQMAIHNNFQYIGKVGMTMMRMIGLNTKNVRNNWFDEKSMKDYKTEPILIFKKNKSLYPWE